MKLNDWELEERVREHYLELARKLTNGDLTLEQIRKKLKIKRRNE